MDLVVRLRSQQHARPLLKELVMTAKINRRMREPNGPTLFPSLRFGWRHVLLLFIVIGSLAFMLSKQPFGQNPNYHAFADRRQLVGIPNCFDVLSNIPLLFIGMAGMRFCLGKHSMSLRPEWLAFFSGVALASAGSAYYHWNPGNQTLLWDSYP
jgi:hypothetical protein